MTPSGIEPATFRLTMYKILVRNYYKITHLCFFFLIGSFSGRKCNVLNLFSTRAQLLSLGIQKRCRRSSSSILCHSHNSMFFDWQLFSYLLKRGFPFSWVGKGMPGIFSVCFTPQAVAFLREIPVETEQLISEYNTTNGECLA